jgi:hypothetical protein
MSTSIVFYYTPQTNSAEDTVQVCVKSKRINSRERQMWHAEVGLRAEIVRGGVAHALDTAKPRKGEIVLNSAPAPK